MALIAFNTSPPRFAHLGGGAWLPDLSLWPLTPEGKPMMPLMPLDNSFFLIPTLGSDDWAMTVFVAVNYRQNGQAFDPGYARRFAANDQSAYDRFDCAYSKILLHPKGGAELVHPEIDYPLFPKIFIGLRKETEDEIAAAAKFRAVQTADIAPIHVPVQQHRARLALARGSVRIRAGFFSAKVCRAHQIAWQALLLGAVGNWFVKRILRQKAADARRKYEPMPPIGECF